MVQWLETLNVSGWEQSISRKCKRDVTVICVVTSLFREHPKVCVNLQTDVR